MKIASRILSIGLLALLPGARPAHARAVAHDVLPISSGFGMRIDPFTGLVRVHRGIDVPGAFGTPIHAAAAGWVSFAGRAGGYGNMVELSHGDGSRTRYAHLAAILVRVGDRVEQRAIIGRMGSSGRSTGSHLHFELWSGDRTIDPLPYLRSGQPVPVTPGRRPFRHDIAADAIMPAADRSPACSAFATARRRLAIAAAAEAAALPGGDAIGGRSCP